MEKKYSKRKKGLRKLILFAIPIIFIGTTLAKYSSNTNQEVVFEAKNFYFESDLLHDATNPISYTYQKGVDEISIALKNNIDDYNFSEVEIQYEVKITDQEGNSITDKLGTTVRSQTGEISNTAIESKEVKFTNLQAGTYVVTATATKPYEKTLQGTFTLLALNEEITYEVSDSENSSVLYLTINTNDYSGDLAITWPKGVCPDSTNENFQSVDSGFDGGSTVVSISADSEYSFRFFKSDLTDVFTDENFSVERD